MNFAYIRDIKKGDKLKTDSGFTCMKKGAIKIVHQDKSGLYIKCAAGNHYLYAQEELVYIGLYKVTKKRKA